MAKLDSLIVDLQVNTAELRKGLDEANAKLDGFGKKLNDLAGVVVFEKMARMAFEAAKALATFTLHGAHVADISGKMAQSAGISVESFSKMAYAAGLSDVNTEALGTALVKLNKNITEASTGQAEAAALFQALGVSATDSSGRLRNADEVMGDMADRFSRMADGAAKSTLAAQLFGKAVGPQLIPFLNGGREGLAALGAEAERLGVVITSKTAASAEQFNDNLARLKTATTAVATNASAQLTPALTALTDQFLTTKEGTDTLRNAAEILATTLKLLVSGGVIVTAVFEVIGKEIANVASTVADLLAGRFSDAAKILSREADNWSGAWDTATSRLEAIWTSSTETLDEEAGKQKTIADLNADAIAAAQERKKKAIEDQKTALKTLTTFAQSLETQIASFGFGELGLIEARLASGDLAEALEKVGVKADELHDKIYEAAQVLYDLKLNLKMDEINFEVKRTETRTDAGISDRRLGLARAIAPNAEAAARLDTAGFKSFDDALSQLAAATNRNAKLLGEAELLKYQNDLEGYRNAILGADESQRAAEAAGRAADAFVDLAKQTVEKQRAVVGMALNVLSSIGESGKEVGQLVNSAMQGFAAGGIWGAIIAVVANLFSKLAAVGEFIDTAFSNFMEAFSQLNDSFSVLFTGLTKSLMPVMRALGIAFKAVNDILVPVFEALEQIRAPFVQLAEGFLDLLESTGILDFVISLVSGIFRVVGLAVSAVVLGIQYIWGALLRVVRGIVALFTGGKGTRELDKTIAEHDANIENTKEAMAANANAIGKERPSPSGGTTSGGGAGGAGGNEPVDETFEEVWARNEERARQIEAVRYAAYSDAIAAGQGFEAASEAGRRAVEAWTAQNPIVPIAEHVDALGDAAGEAAKAVNKLNASLTNVPEGFKYQLRAFEATQATGTLPGGGDTNVTVLGSVMAEIDLANLIERISSQRAFRKTGKAMAGNYR